MKQKNSIKFIVLLANMLVANLLLAQNKSDVMLIKQQLVEHNNSDSIKHFSLLIKKNPLLLPFTTTLFFYQNIISPQLATDCPHIPSCSNFSKQCIAKYGFVKGVALSADRLTRCSPISIMDLPSYSFNYFTNKINDLPIYYYFKQIKH
jgi:putative component of membrane protein insertase Oxa1/YidC/SpoIIIJ protein YidD